MHAQSGCGFTPPIHDLRMSATKRLTGFSAIYYAQDHGLDTINLSRVEGVPDRVNVPLKDVAGGSNFDLMLRAYLDVRV